MYRLIEIQEIQPVAIKSKTETILQMFTTTRPQSPALTIICQLLTLSRTRFFESISTIYIHASSLCMLSLLLPQTAMHSNHVYQFAIMASNCLTVIGSSNHLSTNEDTCPKFTGSLRPELNPTLVSIASDFNTGKYQWVIVTTEYVHRGHSTC